MKRLDVTLIAVAVVALLVSFEEAVASGVNQNLCSTSNREVCFKTYAPPKLVYGHTTISSSDINLKIFTEIPVSANPPDESPKKKEDSENTSGVGSIENQAVVAVFDFFQKRAKAELVLMFKESMYEDLCRSTNKASFNLEKGFPNLCSAMSGMKDEMTFEGMLTVLRTAAEKDAVILPDVAMHYISQGLLETAKHDADKATKMNEYLEAISLLRIGYWIYMEKWKGETNASIKDKLNNGHFENLICFNDGVESRCKSALIMTNDPVLSAILDLFPEKDKATLSVPDARKTITGVNNASQEQLGAIFDIMLSAIKMGQSVEKKEYVNAAAELMHIMRPFEDGIPEKYTVAYDTVIKYALLAAQLAEAKDGKEVASIIEAAAAPVGAYRSKYENSFNVSISGFMGGGGGMEWATGDFNESQWSGGVFAPIGLDFSAANWYYRGMGDNDGKKIGKVHWGLFLSVIDFGSYADFPLGEGNGDLQIREELKFRDLLAPGAYLNFGVSRRYPIIFGFGASYNPYLRLDESEDSVSVVRGQAYIAVDVTMFPLAKIGHANRVMLIKQKNK